MDRKCSKCGGELVEGALLDAVTFHSVIFTPIDELNKIKAGVICDTCTQCGGIENFRVDDCSKLKTS